MTDPILNPCPFCNGNAEFSLGKTGDGNDWHYIECENCAAIGPQVNYASHNILVKESLAEVWNARAAIAAYTKAVSSEAVLKQYRYRVEDGLGWSNWRNEQSFMLFDVEVDVRYLFAAPPAPAVPAGWKLVPVEPTHEMSVAFGFPWEKSFPKRYRAMIAAAPEIGQ